MRLWPVDDNQNFAELEAFVRFATERDVRRYLEIGSRNGNSFYAVMANLRPGAFGMAIDLPENADTLSRLQAALRGVEMLGMDTALATGSSRDAAVLAQAEARAPFDLILIDGDHRLDGVRADWNDYAALSPIVAFHDIAAPDDHRSDGHPNGVGRFWRELKKTMPATREIVAPDSALGFGIVFREKVR